MNSMNECCCGRKNPLSALLKFIAMILIIYGLWYHQWSIIISAFIISIIGCVIRFLTWKSTGGIKNARAKRKK
jgi:hypothetical protein